MRHLDGIPAADYDAAQQDHVERDVLLGKLTADAYHATVRRDYARLDEILDTADLVRQGRADLLDAVELLLVLRGPAAAESVTTPLS